MYDRPRPITTSPALHRRLRRRSCGAAFLKCESDLAAPPRARAEILRGTRRRPRRAACARRRAQGRAQEDPSSPSPPRLPHPASRMRRWQRPASARAASSPSSPVSARASVSLASRTSAAAVASRKRAAPKSSTRRADAASTAGQHVRASQHVRARQCRASGRLWAGVQQRVSGDEDGARCEGRRHIARCEPRTRARVGDQRAAASHDQTPAGCGRLVPRQKGPESPPRPAHPPRGGPPRRFPRARRPPRMRRAGPLRARRSPPTRPRARPRPPIAAAAVPSGSGTTCTALRTRSSPSSSRGRRSQRWRPERSAHASARSSRRTPSATPACSPSPRSPSTLGRIARHRVQAEEVIDDGERHLLQPGQEREDNGHS